MKQCIHTLQDIKTFRDHLRSPEIRDAAAGAKSILAHIYSMDRDEELAIEVSLLVKASLPEAVIIGASTVGEIAFGQTYTVSTLIVFNFFESTRLLVTAQACPRDEEYITGRELGARIHRSATDIAGVLLLATPLSLDISHLLKGMSESLGDCLVFGGGAGDYAAMVKSWVLFDGKLFNQGLVAVTLIGENLRIAAHTNLGWTPIGRQMKVTGVEGMKIVSIDNKPALEVYQRYINVPDIKDLGLVAAEFPFLFSTDRGIMARVPIGADPEGHLVFMGNIPLGQKFRIGYGDPQNMLDTTGNIHQAMRHFGPEGILVFSCGCRRYLMQDNISLETLPLQEIAPTAGFHTYGEFYGFGDGLQLLNAELLAIGMRESTTARQTNWKPDENHNSTVAAIPAPHDPYARQHLLVVSSLVRFIGSVTDELEQVNTDLRKMADTLRETQQLYQLLADNSSDVIWLLDLPDFRFRYVSPSIKRQRGWSPEEIMAMPLSAILSPEIEARVRAILVQLKDKPALETESSRFITIELELPHRDGRRLSTEIAATIFLDANKEPYQVLGISRDISERKAAEEAVRHMAFYDHLTGLANRRLLEDRLNQSLAKARRDHLGLALLFIDLDRFKAVNDNLGHEVGDWLLQRVAERLLQCLRESDTVARIGGDEFIILLHEINKFQSAVDIAEKIRAALEIPFTTNDGQQINISSSIGVVTCPEHSTEARDLMRMGDQAMYFAKKGGRNAVELYRFKNNKPMSW